MIDRTLIILLTLLPKNLMSRIAGCFANSKVSRPFIPAFAKRYKIDLNEAGKAISEYPTLNAFFTRHLKPGLRPVFDADNNMSICSPVDGTIAQMGPIVNGTLIQAKGLDYKLDELIGDKEEASQFQDGYFMTIYLAPTDYHRMHHYLDGFITGLRVIPGRLFPVNVLSVNNVKNLFPINERITTYLDNKQGKKSAIVKVGATIVGKIKLAYHDAESNKGIALAQKFDSPIEVKKADEMGYFAMGSTVVMVYEKGSYQINSELKAGNKVKLGENLGQFI